MKKLQKSRIVDHVGTGMVRSTRANRDMPPREKIEETIVNLATVLGFNTIERQTIRDATEMYRVGDMPFQRGANVILGLSRLLLGRQPPAG